MGWREVKTLKVREGRRVRGFGVAAVEGPKTKVAKAGKRFSVG